MTRNGCTPLFLLIWYFVVVVTVKNNASERKLKYGKDQRCSNKYKEEHPNERTVFVELKKQIKVISINVESSAICAHPNAQIIFKY